MHANDTLVFWLAIAAMIALSLAFVLPRLIARRPGPSRNSRSELNVAIYRGQLADLERERIAGAIGAADFERARLELERRMLSEARDEAAVVDRSARRTAAALVVMIPAAAIGLYVAVGNPAAVLNDVSAAQSRQPLDGTELRSQLLAHLANAPQDARAWIMLARADMSADRFDAAASSYAKALAASPKVARDAGIWCEYADALGMAQGGSLVGKPAELIRRAIALDAVHPRALEMAGSLEYERGDFRAASRYWKQLLGQLAPESASHRELASAIARADRLAATSLSPPGAKGGG